MAANGTPQSYLSRIQNSPSEQYRDRSMEQDTTNSGNPQGYIPQNRYIPPSFDPVTGQWSTQGLQYSVPQAYGMGQQGMPTGPMPMPVFGPQRPQQQQLSAQQQSAVSGAGPGIVPSNRVPMPQFNGTPQYAPTQPQQPPSNSLQTTYANLQNNAPASLGHMPQFASPTSSPQDTYMHTPHGGYGASLGYSTVNSPAVAQPASGDRSAVTADRSVGSGQPVNAGPIVPNSSTLPHAHMPRFGERMMVYQGGRVRGTEFR